MKSSNCKSYLTFDVKIKIMFDMTYDWSGADLEIFLKGDWGDKGRGIVKVKILEKILVTTCYKIV